MSAKLSVEELQKEFTIGYGKLITSKSSEPLVNSGKMMLLKEANIESLIIHSVIITNEIMKLREDISKLTNLIANT